LIPKEVTVKKALILFVFVFLFNSFLFASEYELRISGGTAHIPIMKDVAKTFMSENKNVKVVISGGGSGVGIKQVGAGIVDIGNSGRDLKKSEIEKYNLVPYKIAIDGIAVVVNPSNRISDLTLEQVKEIFKGKVKNWKELGGVDAKINVYTRDRQSGTRKTFEKLALGKTKITSKALIVSSNGNMKVMVGQDRNAIGYLSVGYLDKSVKALKIDGIYPSLENIKSGKYKIQRYLYMITKKNPSDIASKFIDTVLSDYGQSVVKKHNFIPVR